MKTLWVVYGTCGEYSDRREWNVCAYPTEKMAQRHVDLAQTRANELGREYESWYDVPAKANQYDPQMACDYTGTDYGVCMIEVRDKLPI